MREIWNYAQSQGKVREIDIILDIIRFSFKAIEHLNKKLENYYVKHVMFFVQIAKFKVSEILLKVREKSGKIFRCDAWQPC